MKVFPSLSERVLQVYQTFADRYRLWVNARNPSVVNEGVVGCNGEDRSHLICTSFSFLLLQFHQFRTKSTLNFKSDLHGALPPTRLDRLLGDMQVVLWEPRRLVKDYVTEWCAAVKELRHQGEGLV